MPIRTLLVPTDFSELSNAAVDFAFLMCEEMRPSIIFLYIDEWPDHSDVEAPLHNEYGIYKKDEANALLNDLVQRAEDQGLRGSKVLVDGIPSAEIIRTAIERKADLIVIGTHGKTGLTHIMIGRQAGQVVRESPCPVVTVKSPKHEYPQI
ncbi:MAG: universal stress protein [Nitrospira sp.]|nr:universal stress protein [Candidatus Manganitrophaceae bacterium]HIL35149.1 universal stress protein [Candidatus Manganitrophaceae bacterium]